jgi:mutator protein MutT
MPLETNNLPEKKIGVAVIKNKQGQILIDKRLATGLMAGLWEFPGGKIEDGETVAECIEREIKEELDIEIKVGQHLITINHTYSKFKVTLIVHLCEMLKGEPKPIECQEIRWINISDLRNFAFPEANINIINALLKYSMPPLS